MKGLSPMLRKEAAEVRHTWRLFVLPAILVICAVTAAVMTYLLPTILESAGESQSSMTIEVAEPTMMDAYRMFMQQLSQIALIAVIVATAGSVSSELRGGAGVLVLTKPVSRVAYVVAKAISNGVVLALAAGVGVLAFVGLTLLLFGEIALAELAGAVGLWLVLALLFCALMILLSSLMNSQAGAAGLGLGVYAVFSALGVWSTARAYTPVGLLDEAGRVLEGGSPETLAPLLTGIAAIVLFVTAAGWAFRRREI